MLSLQFICQFKGGNAGGDLETIARECFRAFDGANQEARRDIARLLGTLIAYTQQVAILQTLLRYSSPPDICKNFLKSFDIFSFNEL